MTYCKKFASGLRMVVKKIDGLLSVSMGAIVGTGSCFETQDENGISHFIEHMMFKGTQKISALDWEKEQPLYEQIIAKYDEKAKTLRRNKKNS